ncbi:MAG TPA: ATP-binding protein [Candidatus Didemnitutus sp.]|nr:ATP-binding protein [Candidatus Didemnitutus sp.]
MRSMTQRLTVWYAVAVTATVVVAMLAGRWLLEKQVHDNLNLLQDAEDVEVIHDLGRDMEQFGDAELVRQMRVHSEADEDLFFFQIHSADGRVLFRSPNLGDSVLPDLSLVGPRWTATLPPHGPVYISRYAHGKRILQIGSRLEPTEHLFRQYTGVSLVLAAVVAAASLGLGYGISRLALRPLRDIRKTADRITADNLSARIPVPPGRDEAAELVQLLNAMFDRLEAAFRQVRQFSADASHELKTPLTLIRLNAERLRQQVADRPDAVGAVDALFEEIAGMNQLIESLLFLAKAESGVLPLARSEQQVRDFVESVREDAAVLAEDRGQRLVVERSDAGSVRFDRNLMRQVLLNLVNNAVAVSSAGGTITLRSLLADGRWRLEVLDEGPGLPPDQVERVFERFMRLSKPDRGTDEGHGLGLAICRGLAQLHGGAIWAANRADRKGLVVTVELPVA